MSHPRKSGTADPSLRKHVTRFGTPVIIVSRISTNFLFRWLFSVAPPVCRGECLVQQNRGLTSLRMLVRGSLGTTRSSLCSSRRSCSRAVWSGFVIRSNGGSTLRTSATSPLNRFLTGRGPWRRCVWGGRDGSESGRKPPPPRRAAWGVVEDVDASRAAGDHGH